MPLSRQKASSNLDKNSLWPLVLYFGFVMAIVLGMLGSSYVLGQRAVGRAKNEPYESGIVSTGTARIRLSARFYLMAMFFVIFDLESVFLYTWAIAVPELGWSGYSQALVFVVLVLVQLGYLWRMRALE